MGPLRRILRLEPRRESLAGLVDEEIALHLDLRAAELMEQGWSEPEARAEAARLFGDLRVHQRQCLTIDEERMTALRKSDAFDALRQDLAFAARAFGRRPLFSLAAIAILALGIGANTAVFSIVQGVLLKGLPFEDPSRLVMIINGDSRGSIPVSQLERQRYRQETALFARMGTWYFDVVTISGSGEAERIPAVVADADALPTAGIAPLMGRGFTAGETEPGANTVVLVSHNYWKTRLGGAADVLGRKLIADGSPMTIVGVLPANARMPGDFTGPRAELVVPMEVQPVPDPRNLHYLFAMARLAPGVEPAAVDARLALVAKELVETVPTLPDDFTIRVSPVEQEVLGQFRPAVLMLLWAVGLLLLLACANVAGLLLAHAETRHREFAVRASLGAAPARLARQVLTESLILGGLGGIAGTLLGSAALLVLLALSPPGLPRVDEVALNPLVLGFAVLASLATALLFGLAPALSVRTRDTQSVLRGEGRGATSGRDRHLVRRGLVLAEIALAVTLAAGAGLVVRTWLNVVRTDPGFAPDGLLTFHLSLPGEQYLTREARWRFFTAVSNDLAAMPGVRAAGGVSALPLAQQAGDWGFRIEGRPPAREGERNPFADRIVVTPGYFEAMQVPLKQGRLFTADDDAAREPVILLNEKTAKRYWPDGRALDARIRLSTNIDTVWRRVIGIVGDVRSRGLEAEARQEFYFPHAQYPANPESNATGSLSFVVRGAGNPVVLTGAVRDVVRRLDPGVPLSEVRTMSGVLDATLSVRKLQLLLLGFFAASGLLLVAAGVYGVVAFLVGERSREFGVRLALGADRRGILGLVLRDSTRLAVLGVLAGLAGAVVLGKVLQSVLFGVNALDPLVIGTVPVLVLVVVLAATLGPALKAARTDPGTTLRSE